MLSEELYEKLRAAQRGYCANKACGIKLDYSKKNTAPHVDHCHKTQAVRGLLCGMCNLALGMVKDNPNRLRGLADYLEEHLASTAVA